MNTVANTFEALVSSLRVCPEEGVCDVYAVNLVSQLAAMPERRACVAFVHAGNFGRFAGLERSLYLLQSYGVQLYRRFTDNKEKPGFFVFAELTDPQPDPFAGAQAIAFDAEDVLKVAA